jgi:hypothetical protein
MINFPKSFHCWVGPLGEPHDFRLDNIELEIKTTRNLKRTHIISNLDQLNPSKDHKLTLVSLQIGPAGAHGVETLRHLVDNVCQQIATGSAKEEANIFQDMIRRAGYREEHSKFYLGPLILRTDPRIIQVNNSFPRITKDNLDFIIGKEANRIGDVQYRVNVDGLGIEIHPDNLVATITDQAI